MKIDCINGYYKFYPKSAIEIRLLEVLYGVRLFKMNGFYTFEALRCVQDYSLKNKAVNGITYNITYSAQPEEILLANKLTFDLLTLTVVPVASIAANSGLAYDNLRLVSLYLVQAYSRFQGEKIRGFTAYYDFNQGFYSYSDMVTI